MKLTLRILVLVNLFFLSINVCNGQEKSITKKYKKQSIQKLSQLMNDFYVFPKVAKKTANHLETLYNNGHFEPFKDNTSFAAALTASVQEINKDKHMIIRLEKPYKNSTDGSKEKESRLFDQIVESRQYNAGFNTVKIMDGNVGYLDLRAFVGLDKGKPAADAYMKLISNCDAIIIDLSQNYGGYPSMVQYLCSYFFDEKLLLNSLYWREGARTQEFWTLDKIGGTKMPDVPLFVITSNNTFSGAEEFSYNMQTRKRAVLVGQTSGGGANPGGIRKINDDLIVIIPTGKAINPITMTNWEGVGVIPEVVTTVDEALNKAHELAKSAAADYKNNTEKKYKQMCLDFENELNQFTIGKSDKAILQSLNDFRDANLLGELDINSLGYEYLMDHKKTQIAESIFMANTILYPNSSNTFDSYAEALVVNGKLETALLNSQKSVKIATANGNQEMIELFKNNLDAIKQKLKDKK